MFQKSFSFIFLLFSSLVRGEETTLITNSTTGGLITFLASSTLTRNRPYKVTVSIGEGAKEPVNVKIDITSRVLNSYHPPGESTTTPPPIRIYGSEQFVLEASQTKAVELNLQGLKVDENSPGETMLALKVSATGGIKFEDQQDLTIEEKSNSLLIQTDKPLYKPGEVIRMRVVNLDREMKPIKKNDIEVSMKDPTGAIMKIWKNAEMKNPGLFSDKFKLSPEPNLGHWVIEATSGKETVSREVLVSEYVLPKFKVEILLPPFATFNDSKVTVRVKGSYTYGKSVKGKVVVSAIGPESYSYIWRNGIYERPPQTRVDKTVTLEDGVASLTFDLANELKVKDDTEYMQQKEVTFKAILTEQVTGLMENDTRTLTVYRFPFKIEHISVTEEYKPGLPYQMTFKIEKQDGTPLMDSNPTALKIRHGFSYDKPGSFMTKAIPQNGVVTLTFKPPTNDLINVNGIEITYKGLKQMFYSGGRASSKSDTFIQLTLKNEKGLKVNDTAEVIVKCTRPFNSLHYILTSKSEILKTNLVKFKESAETHSLSVQLPHSAAPHAFLLIYMNVAEADNEVVADVLDIKLDGALENFLNLSLTKDLFKPGEKLEIQMETMENSVVALRGIDQSVLLLKEEDSDLTMNMIKQELDKYDHNHYGFSRGAGLSFNKAGILVMTNGAIEKNVRYQPYARRRIKGGFKQRGGFGGPPIAMAFSEAAPMAKVGLAGGGAAFGVAERTDGSNGGGAGGDNQVQTRKNFPETWLWEEISTDESISTFKTIVPDTITSWVISGFSLNSENGIGICTGPQTLKTFRAFFIRMNNPYSVVKGETIGLQILVANYMKDEIEADIVVLNEDNEFKFVMKSATKELKKRVKVPSQSVISVTFLIVPTKIGTISLKARGVTKMAGDAIEVPLIVKGPGERITKNEAALIDQRLGGSMKTVMKMEAKFPMKRVEGADSVIVSIIGDLLGPAIKNLDNLIQLPVGCGEQNMLYFVPDIVVMQYLSAKGMLTNELKTKLTSYLEQGYQRELRYKRPEGSYSAFGKDDQMGSTWLTAFVVKSFVAAMQYITIDQFVITESLNYLKLMQGVQGGFEEKGHVLHSELKGGVGDKNIGLTAYVTLTFLELPDKYKEEYGNVMRLGLEYVMKNWENLEKDQYVSILTTYILHKVPLIVKGPGERITKNEAALIDQRLGGSMKTVMKMEAKFPMKRVEGADSVIVSIIGDLLGPAIKNLDNLIQLPVGCGEQNMLYFVPDIVVMQYLSAKGMLTNELKTKLTSYLEQGYQRELRYKRPEGSYSAFGKDDQMGSTWLTAFVVKSFVAAMQYITIDQFVITESLNYLKLMQGVQGGFEEKGHVLHSELKGGVGDKNIGLTAYVTLTFLELPDKYKEEYGNVMRLGLEYVMKNWENLEKDQYVSILTTYILHKATDPRKDKAFRRLEEFAKKDSAGLKYWSDSPNAECDECIQAPAAVEMTSYALLIYLKRDMLGEALPIVKWLLKQRNSNGGFHSTQDTVVGLTALAKFAALTSANVTDLTLRVKEGETLDSFAMNKEVLRVKKETLIVQQELILSPTTRFVQFEAEGEGISLVQLTWSYNTEETSKGKHFLLKTDIDGTPVKFVLNVCASYLASNESNMVILEINLPTGYAFPEDVSKKKSEKVKRADLEKSGQTLMVYFEKMNSTKICSSYTITRAHLAANQAPTYVLIYDYYVPSKRERLFYKPPLTTVCDLCDDEECRKNNECSSTGPGGKPGDVDHVEPAEKDSEMTIEPVDP